MDVMLWTGTGTIGTAIVRRIGRGMKIIAADINPENAEIAAQTLYNAGYDVVAMKADISSRKDVSEIITECGRYGELKVLINSVGVVPSRTPIEKILLTELYGTSVLLEEVGKAIAVGGAGLNVLSQAGRRLSPLGCEADEQFALCPTEELLNLDILSRDKISDRLHAHSIAHYAAAKRVMAQALKWGERGARLNSVSVGLTASPSAREELSGPRGEFYRNMYMKAPAGRLACADDIAAVAEILMSHNGAFITGTDILVDGGATASYNFGSLKPQ